MALWLKPLMQTTGTGFNDPADPIQLCSSLHTPGQMLEKSRWKHSGSIDQEVMFIQGAGFPINSFFISIPIFHRFLCMTVFSCLRKQTLLTGTLLCWHCKEAELETQSVHISSGWGINKFVALQFPWILSFKKDITLTQCYWFVTLTVFSLMIFTSTI